VLQAFFIEKPLERKKESVLNPTMITFLARTHHDTSKLANIKTGD